MTAQERLKIIEDLEQWDSTPDGRLEVSAQIKRLIAAIRKEEPKWAVSTHRTSAAVAREVFMLCKECDNAGIWPNGLLDSLRLVLSVPDTATMTTDGEHTDGYSPQMRAVAEYWRKNPDAKNSEVGRMVRNSKGNPLGATSVRNLLKPATHPGFAEHVEEMRAAARAAREKLKAAPEAMKAPRPDRRRVTN